MKGTYLEACGACLLPMKVHPVKYCQYKYKTLSHRGQIVGYELIRKKPKKH